jgi:hypothetical protein
MAYFAGNPDGIERAGKVVADILCALLLLTFAIVFFGWVGGVLAFLVLQAALIAVDYLVASSEDVAGTVR